jgi:hypothetical protein
MTSARKAAGRLVGDAEERFTHGAEGDLLRSLLPPDSYAALMAAISDLTDELDDDESGSAS